MCATFPQLCLAVSLLYPSNSYFFSAPKKKKAKAADTAAAAAPAAAAPAPGIRSFLHLTRSLFFFIVIFLSDHDQDCFHCEEGCRPG